MNLNVVKGLLVLMVVVDHNDFSRSVFPGFLLGLSFHVVGFMSLPFLRPAAPLDRQFGQYLFRLYHPFFVLMSVLAIAVAVSTPVAPLHQLSLWLLSAYSGNYDVLKQTTHLAMLWYLPSFVALVALRTVIWNAPQGMRLAALALVCVLHPLIGMAPRALQDYLPLGLLPALYVIPLALLIVQGQRQVFARLSLSLALPLALLLFVAVKALQMRAGLYYEVGFAIVPDYTRPAALLLDDLESLTGVWLVFQLGRVNLGKLVDTAGKYSLQMYLFHPFVAALVSKLLTRSVSGTAPLILFCVSFAITVVLAIVLSRFLAEQHLIRRLLFPRHTAEFAGALRWQARGAHAAIRPSGADTGHPDR